MTARPSLREIDDPMLTGVGRGNARHHYAPASGEGWNRRPSIQPLNYVNSDRSIIRPVPGLTTNWDFVASRQPLAFSARSVVASLLHRSPVPDASALVPLRAKDTWIVYFVFAPAGHLEAGHRFTLSRLRDMGIGVMVVCAASQPSAVPAELRSLADALYWKALSGYDFSGYALALHEISRLSPHARVLVMNDSVFGPFVDLRPFVAAAAWDLTGFTASHDIGNHIQSYAFLLDDVTPQRMARLARVFPTLHAHDRVADVIVRQELALARVAARSMRVGAFWYSVSKPIYDPSLHRALELVDAGFPFLKRSLLGKHAKFAPRAAVEALLQSRGHPVPDAAEDK